MCVNSDKLVKMENEGKKIEINSITKQKGNFFVKLN